MLQVPPVDRHKLLLYLEAHNLSIRDFLSVIKGEKLPRFVSMWKISRENHGLHVSGFSFHSAKTR